MDKRPRAHFHILVAAAILALVAPAATWAQQAAVTVLHTFAAGTDGALPRASLIHATDGNFYGTTYSGGATSNGTVFKMMPGGAVTVLHAFTDGTDGALPFAGLIQATDGNFYGTTSAGGPNGTGTVYMMTPAGSVTVLYAFSGGADGASPRAALIQAADGNFYGTTYSGGAGSSGTVFTMTPAGTVTVLHAFAGGADGASPNAALIQATDGNFYGTTWLGGDPLCGGCGTVFKMTPAGTVTVLHAFADGADGVAPSAVIQATDGNFYGTTEYGGASTFGVVFQMTPTGIVTILHAFAGGTDGAYPLAALIQATDGNLYGTSGGGEIGSDFGTLFRTTPAGAATVLHAFAGGTDGVQPFAALIQAPDGSFYGTTYGGGGAANNGVVFELTFATAPAITTQPANQTIASQATANLTVVASGGGLGYQWYVGTTGTTTSPVAGATASSYTTPVLTSTTRYWVRVSNSVSTADSNTATVTVRIAPGDFDADGKADITVYRPSTGTWFILKSSANYTTSSAYQWGISTDVPVAGDYDGDGKTDAAVYRPSTGTWFILNSSTNYTTSSAIQWGGTGDIPVLGDYDGDGKADVTVYRPSTGTWYSRLSTTGYSTYIVVQWGGAADVPVPGDYDGDGKTDVAVYRPSTGTWYVLRSSTNYTTSFVFQWGGTGDIPAPGDYDGDGRTDVAVYRPSTGTWFILKSSTSYTTGNSPQWGAGGDLPVPGDYDGDGKTDVAVYRPSTGTWFVLTSSTNYTTSRNYQWGAANGDVPVKSRP